MAKLILMSNNLHKSLNTFFLPENHLKSDQQPINLLIFNYSVVIRFVPQIWSDLPFMPFVNIIRVPVLRFVVFSSIFFSKSRHVIQFLKFPKILEIPRPNQVNQLPTNLRVTRKKSSNLSRKFLIYAWFDIRSSQFQWPKRTHTNSPLSHSTHTKASTERPTAHNDSSALYNVVNFTSTSHPIVVKETFNTSNNKESGDIKNSSDISSVNLVVNKDVVILSSSKLNNSISNSSGSETPRVERLHPVKMVALRPNGKKYITNFDAAPESSGLLTSLMKVFGMNKCPEIPPTLDGPVEVDTDYESEESVNKKFEGKLQPGGRFKPSECRWEKTEFILQKYINSFTILEHVTA